MFLKSIHIKNFKRFKELDIDFPGALTVVKGSNEQGKSTLVAAIEAGIFTNPSSRAEAVQSLRSWNAERAPELTLVFEKDGKTYELSKDFEAKEACLTDKQSGKAIRDIRRIEAFFAGQGGYVSQKLFESISCVKQDNIEEVASGRKEIDRALEGIVTAGSSQVSASDVIARAQKRLLELRKGMGDRPVKTPGVIRGIQDLLKEVQAEKEETEKRAADFQNARREIELRNRELEYVSRELQARKEEYEQRKAAQASMLKKEGLLRELKEVSRLVEQARLIDRELKDFEARKRHFKIFEEISLEEFQEAKKEFTSLLDTKRTLEKTLALQKNSAAMPIRGAAGLALVLFGIGSAGFVTGNSIFFLAWVAAGAILAASFILFAGLQGSQHKKLKEEIGRIGEEVNEKEALLAKVLKETRSKDLQDLELKWKEFERLSTELAKRQDRLETVLAGLSFDGLVARSVDIQNAIAIEDMKLASFSGALFQPAFFVKALEKEIQDLEEKAGELAKEIARKEATVSNYAFSHERLVSLEERETVLQGELEEALTKEAVYALVVEYLTRARLQTIAEVRKKLERHISEYLSSITHGRYSNVVLSDDFMLSVFSPEKKDFLVPDGVLSQGTQDQIYLVARFAILKIFAQSNQRPLIILDDPFHSFDAKRRAETRRILEELSKNFQILLLTHSDEYDNWGIVRELP